MNPKPLAAEINQSKRRAISAFSAPFPALTTSPFRPSAGVFYLLAGALEELAMLDDTGAANIARVSSQLSLAVAFALSEEVSLE